MRKLLFITLSVLICVWYIDRHSLYIAKNTPSASETSQATTTQEVLSSATTTPPTKSGSTATTTNKTPSKAKLVATKTEVPSAPTPVATEPAADFEKINQKTREAIVNILCSGSSNKVSGISGTGVIIDPKGIIMTNAHIGQYLLLKDFPRKDSVECVIRTGSPAHPQYLADLTYISPNWVENNKTILKDQDPKGTGEYDFAFLRITKNISNAPLPSSFPYVSPNTQEIIKENQVVLLASYPAGFLGTQSLLQDLNIASAITRIQTVFTFKESTIDLIAVGGTVISQKGASGGAVVDEETTLIGMISTSSEETTTSERKLNAITLPYISRTLQGELGVTLTQFLSQDLEKFTEKFQSTTAPLLTKLITDELNK